MGEEALKRENVELKALVKELIEQARRDGERIGKLEGTIASLFEVLEEALTLKQPDLGEDIFARIARQYAENIEVLRALYLDKTVRLVHGDPTDGDGRLAVITDIVLRDEKPLFLCMVIMHGTKPSERVFLSSRGWTRAYRPRHHFEVVDDACATSGEGGE